MSKSDPKGPTKAEVLQSWHELPEDVNLLAVMAPIPYKTEGRTYGTDGIRIDGSPKFVDAVLGKLKELIDGENAVTRLGLSRSPANTDFKSNPNAQADAEVCYIRLHVRGREGSISMGAFGGEEVRDATKRYAALLGVEENDRED